MKIKNILGITAIVSTMALGVAFAVSPNKAAVVKATGPYSIGNDEYEVAFLEQYNDIPNAHEVEDYSYKNDKPLGNNTICGNLYGNAGPSAAYLNQTGYVTNLLSGVNDDLQWRFSGLKIKGAGSPNRLYASIENNSSNWNICKPESYPEATYPDEYAIGQLMLTHSSIDRAGAMVTVSAIKNIQNISFFWRTSYTSRVYICYQIEGETEWKEFHSMSDSNIDDGVPISGNYTGTRGWDSYGYTTFNSSSWQTKELYGKTAKLAIVSAGKVSGNFPITAILINANKAAVRYLNTLSYKDGACSESTYDLSKTAADKTHNQDLFHLATEHANADFLAEYEVAGSKTTETSALGLYNHLVSSVSGLGPVKSASSIRFFNGIASFENGSTLAIIISVSAVSLAGLEFVLFKKSKKQK